MQKSWQDLGLWFLGLVVMILGAAFPTYLFHTEGSDSIFGNIVYVLAGILLFLSGLGIIFFYTWFADHQKQAAQNPPAQPTKAPRVSQLS